MFKAARGSISNGRILAQLDQLDAVAWPKPAPKMLPLLFEGRYCCSCLLAGMEDAAGTCTESEENMSNVWFDHVGSNWRWNGQAWIHTSIDHGITSAMILMLGSFDAC